MRVLQFIPYPIQPRTHGGQRRAGAIWDAYRRSGVDCVRAELWPPAFYPEVGRAHLLPARRLTLKRLAEAGHLIELALSPCLLGDGRARAALVRLWRQHRPDVVELEQPFFWPAARELLAAGDVPPARLVYSSQNVEWEMKESIYRKFLPRAEAAEASSRARELEFDLVHRADLVVAVTAADERAFRQAGARRTAVVLNGSDLRAVRPGELERWRERVRSWEWGNYALFVSSDHWPNYAGFLDLVGEQMQFLPPDASLVVVGGLAGVMAASPALRPAIGQRKLHLVAPASDDDLACLLHLASVILLPITAGGGSNLKTIEALLSGRPIVATEFAFRAYEEFRTLPHVTLANDRPAFRRAVQKALLAPPPPAGEPPPGLLELTWPRLGERFVREVKALLSCNAGDAEAA